MTLYVNGEQRLKKRSSTAEINRLRPGYRTVFSSEQPQDRQQNQQLAEWARENVVEMVLFRTGGDRKRFPKSVTTKFRPLLTGLLGK